MCDCNPDSRRRQQLRSMGHRPALHVPTLPLPRTGHTVSAVTRLLQTRQHSGVNFLGALTSDSRLSRATHLYTLDLLYSAHINAHAQLAQQTAPCARCCCSSWGGRVGFSSYQPIKPFRGVRQTTRLARSHYLAFSTFWFDIIPSSEACLVQCIDSSDNAYCGYRMQQ